MTSALSLTKVILDWIKWYHFNTSILVDPTTLGLVDDISVQTTETFTTVSWKIPMSLQKCMNIYTVTAVNEAIGENTECQGTTYCNLGLSSVCPSTTYTIKPTLPIQGAATTQTIDCS